jgi:hypothetical protein
MEGKHFDQLAKHLGTGTARRRVLGGMIGVTAALLTGAAVLEAKPGGGKGKTKVSICHYQGTHKGTPKYKVLKLGAPGAANHLENHEEDTPYVDCCVDNDCAEAAECSTASCVEGACSTTFDVVDTPCVTATGAPGVCDGAGICNAT